MWYNNQVRIKSTCAIMHQYGIFSLREDPRALRLTSELVDLRAENTKRYSLNKLSERLLLKPPYI